MYLLKSFYPYVHRTFVGIRCISKFMETDTYKEKVESETSAYGSLYIKPTTKYNKSHLKTLYRHVKRHRALKERGGKRREKTHKKAEGKRSIREAQTPLKQKRNTNALEA